MNCSKIVEEQVCGDLGEIYYGHVMCPKHKEQFEGFINHCKRSTALQSSKHHSLLAFPGICYIVLLPSGLVKVGYSNTPKLLKTRYTTLRRDHGGDLIVLREFPGGFVTEAVLHDHLKHLRIPGTGELFRYGVEVAELVNKEDHELDNLRP